MDFDPDHVARSPWTIGAIGAFIAAFKFLPGASWKEKVFNGMCGTLIAGFMSPALVEWLHMKSPSYTGGAAFVCGLLGMSLAAAALNAIRETQFGQILTGWLSRRN